MFEPYRNKQSKGWALDDQEAPEHIGVWERFAGNKLWIVLFVTIVTFGLGMIVYTISTPKQLSSAALNESPIGTYTDSAHDEFTEQYIKMAQGRGINIQAGFRSDKSFSITVPCGTAVDEVAFLSRSSAFGIWRRFKSNVTVWTYTEDINDAAPRLTAKTQWSEDKGEFIVRFQRSPGSE